MNKHIAPITMETHHRAVVMKAVFKAKNWDVFMNNLMDMAEEYEKLKVELNGEKSPDAYNSNKGDEGK